MEIKSEVGVKLSRSNLHRCLQRNGISNLEDIEEYKKINKGTKDK